MYIRTYYRLVMQLSAAKRVAVFNFANIENWKLLYQWKCSKKDNGNSEDTWETTNTCGVFFIHFYMQHTNKLQIHSCFQEQCKTNALHSCEMCFVYIRSTFLWDDWSKNKCTDSNENGVVHRVKLVSLFSE